MLCAAATTEWEEEDRLSFLYIHDDIIFFAAAAEDYSAGINFGAKRLSCAALLGPALSHSPPSMAYKVHQKSTSAAALPRGMIGAQNQGGVW